MREAGGSGGEGGEEVESRELEWGSVETHRIWNVVGVGNECYGGETTSFVGEIGFPGRGVRW